jgi:hypothetical protein
VSGTPDYERSLRHALAWTLSSPNECDSDTNTPANVVDGLFAIARAIHGLAEAVKAVPR